MCALLLAVLVTARGCDLIRPAETGEILKSAAVDADGRFTIDHIPPTVHHLSYADSVDVENSGRMLIFEASVQPKKPYIRNGKAARVEIEVTNAQCSETR